MSYKRRVLLASALMLILSWVDNKFLTKRPLCLLVPDLYRWVLHFGILAVIFGAGLFVLAKNEQKWIKDIWVFVYPGVIAILFVLVYIYHFWPVFSKPVLTTISRFRVFFTGPVPFLLLYILSEVGAASLAKKSIN